MGELSDPPVSPARNQEVSSEADKSTNSSNNISATPECQPKVSTALPTFIPKQSGPLIKTRSSSKWWLKQLRGCWRPVQQMILMVMAGQLVVGALNNKNYVKVRAKVQSP